MSVSPPTFRELCDPQRSLWLLLGVLSGWLWHALPAPLPWLSCLPLVIGLALAKRWGSRVAILAGLALQFGSFQAWEPVPEFPRVQCRWVVEITNTGKHPEGRILGGAPKPLNRIVRLSPPDLDVRLGDTLWLRATFLPPHPAGNPGGFDASRWMAQASLAGTLKAVSGEPMVVHRGHGQTPRRQKMTDFVKKTFAKHLSRPAATLWTATALGEMSSLPQAVSDAFRTTGLFHLLAVSGSHMLLLGGAVLAQLTLLRLPRRFAWLLSVIAVWGYTWLLDFPAPVLRASLAYTVIALAMTIGRRPSARNAWFLAAAILLCLDPNSAFNPGVQLSFAAVAGLLWIAPNLKWMLPLPLREGRLHDWFAGPLLASIGASLTTAPLLAWHFQAVPWIGIPAGLIAGLSFEAGFLASLLTLLLGGIGLPHWCFWGFSRAADGLAWASISMVTWCADHVQGSWDLARPEPLTFALWMASGFALALLGTRWRRAGAWLALVWVGLVAWNLRPAPPHLDVWFLDVGQGDAALVRFPGGRNWLVDCGPRSEYYDAGARVIAPALRDLGIRSLDAVVITHDHLDHMGGLDTLLSRFPIGRVFEPASPDPKPSHLWEATRKRLQAQGVPVRTLGAGQILSYGDGPTVRVLAPGEGTAPDANATSIVFRLEYGKHSILFTGDAEHWSEAHQLHDSAALSSDVIKLGHHGSRTSSTVEWLHKVHPGLAFISVAAINRYGHPTPEALARLSEMGTAAWIASDKGGMHLRLTPSGIAASPNEAHWWKGPWERDRRIAF
jgi:competence protein ComEC